MSVCVMISLREWMNDNIDVIVMKNQIFAD